MKPVLDSTDEGSALQACCQPPAKDALTNSPKSLLISVPHYMFHSTLMNCPWISTQPSTLVHCMCQLR
eukprot:6823585-Ditylum_brightwellii.AAC.2